MIMEYDSETTPLPAQALLKCLPELSHVCPQTIQRWQRVGLNGREGRRVRLASQRVGGRRMSSVRQVRDFFAALEQPDDPESPPARSPSARKDAVADAQRLLAQLKIPA
jgi:hypothetical protein